MKCSRVKKEIDRFVYQPDPDPGEEIYRHIDSCEGCARYLEDTRKVAGKIEAIRKKEPLLKNPDALTEDIMNLIREDVKKNIFNLTEKSRKFQVFIVLQHILAAASVCLFLTFCYEQYVVVDKISRLEKQNAAFSQTSPNQTALNLNKAMITFLSDMDMQNRYNELKNRKINLRALFRAAMYVDAAGISPAVVNLPGKTDINITNSTSMQIIKNFDSIHNTIQQ